MDDNQNVYKCKTHPENLDGSNPIPPSHHPHCVCVASTPLHSDPPSRPWRGRSSLGATASQRSSPRLWLPLCSCSRRQWGRWRKERTDPRCSGSRGSGARGRTSAEILAEAEARGRGRVGGDSAVGEQGGEFESLDSMLQWAIGTALDFSMLSDFANLNLKYLQFG